MIVKEDIVRTGFFVSGRVALKTALTSTTIAPSYWPGISVLDGEASLSTEIPDYQMLQSAVKDASTDLTRILDTAGTYWHRQDSTILPTWRPLVRVMGKSSFYLDAPGVSDQTMRQLAAQYDIHELATVMIKYRVEFPVPTDAGPGELIGLNFGPIAAALNQCAVMHHTAAQYAAVLGSTVSITEPSGITHSFGRLGLHADRLFNASVQLDSRSIGETNPQRQRFEADADGRLWVPLRAREPDGEPNRTVVAPAFWVVLTGPPAPEQLNLSGMYGGRMTPGLPLHSQASARMHTLGVDVRRALHGIQMER